MRPKKDSDLKRNKCIMQRVTEAEYDAIQNRARDAHMSLSEYCRTQTLKGKVNISYPVVADMSEIKRLARELSQVGNNLNQIAQYFHMGGARSAYVQEEIHEAIKDLHEIRLWADKQAGDQIGNNQTLRG